MLRLQTSIDLCEKLFTRTYQEKTRSIIQNQAAENRGYYFSEPDNWRKKVNRCDITNKHYNVHQTFMPCTILHNHRGVALNNVHLFKTSID